jgi:hypothetical protein
MMNNEEIEALAKESHYVNQLVTLKQIWGLHTTLGCVIDSGDYVPPTTKSHNLGMTTTVWVKTIKDLFDLGWVKDTKFLVIDENWHNLTLIKYGAT